MAAALRLAVKLCVVCVLGCGTTPKATSVPIHTTIEAPSSVYTLQPILGGWAHYRDGHTSHPDADLVLTHAESGVTAIVYLEKGATNSLDDYVARRRAQIKQKATIVSLEEERSFQNRHSFTTTSFGVYRVTYGEDEGWYPIISAVTRGPAAIVEIFVSGGTYPMDITIAEDLLDGLRFVDSGEGSQQ